MTCCSSSSAVLEARFGERSAQQEISNYRRKGPGKTTRLLRDDVVTVAPGSETLLDVGAGVGALTFELLERGLRHAVAVDASAATLAAGGEEAVRRDRGEQIEWLHGDFVALTGAVAPADIVTLDRVVCCYPTFGSLIDAAATHARRALAVSYPRDVPWVRAVTAVQNLVRGVKGEEFRTLVHPAHEMERLILSRGFTLATRRNTFVWCADVYAKATG